MTRFLKILNVTLYILIALGIVIFIGTFIIGCSTAAHTEVDPATSSVKSKSVERRPTETTKVSITTAPEQPSTYRLKIVKKGAAPCGVQAHSDPIPLPTAK